MSVDEMISGLTVLRCDHEISEHFYQAIVTALRAGQAMRNIAKLDESPEVLSTMLAFAAEDWDAALSKEDE
jgi:hypothetical protein